MRSFHQSISIRQYRVISETWCAAPRQTIRPGTASITGPSLEKTLTPSVVVSVVTVIGCPLGQRRVTQVSTPSFETGVRVKGGSGRLRLAGERFPFRAWSLCFQWPACSGISCPLIRTIHRTGLTLRTAAAEEIRLVINLSVQ